jgi:hypothetical protein
MKILITGDLLEQFQYVERLPEVVKEAQVNAVLFTGNILRAEAREAEWRRALAERRAPRLDLPGLQKQRDDDARSLHRFFATLGSLGVPACFVPGRNDAPERLLVQAAFNAEVVAANVHAVHRSFAPLGGNWIVAGFGGEINAEERNSSSGIRDGRPSSRWIFSGIWTRIRFSCSTPRRSSVSRTRLNRPDTKPSVTSSKPLRRILPFAGALAVGKANSPSRPRWSSVPAG